MKSLIWFATILTTAWLLFCANASALQFPGRLPPGVVFTSQWSGWENLGGTVTSAPTCLAPAVNQLDCYVRGAGGVLQRRWWDGASWNGWQTIPGVNMQQQDDGAAIGPNCVRDSTAMTRCFIWGEDGGLWHRWFPPGSNGWWENLGGALTSAPSCAPAPDAPTISCFARGQSGALFERVFDGNVGSPWRSRGGVLAIGTSPSCVARSGGRVDCVIVGTNESLFHQSMSGGPPGWRQISGARVLTQGISLSPRCQVTSDAVACYTVVEPGPAGGFRAAFRALLEGSAWSTANLGGDFASFVELSCIDGPDTRSYECFSLSAATLSGGQAPRVREFATSPSSIASSWRDVSFPTPPTTNPSIARLNCVAWAPGRVDCFASSGSGGPMMHVWRTPPPAPGGRFRRGG